MRVMRVSPAKVVLASVFSCVALGAPVHGDSALRESVEADYADNLSDLFRHFHANPELSFQEDQTAARLAEELRALGYDVVEGIGGTGLVSVFENGDGPTVMIRADMDGLPVEERSGLEYASVARQDNEIGVERPVMHACGHDVHITSLVGAARQMMDRRDEWSGTLILLGQPAEEWGAGAKAMIDDGLYERFPKPEYAVAFHVSSQLEAGKIQLRPGLVYSSVDSLDITVHGVGSHGAAPHKGVDPIMVASQIVVALQTVVSRNIDPLQPAVVTVGSFHAGAVHNIISDKAELQLTVRSNDPAVRDQLIAAIERVTENVARAMGVPEDLLPEVNVLNRRTPVTMNDPGATAIVQAAFDAEIGADRQTFKPREGMGGEDFSYFVEPNTEGVKGVYFAVGGTLADELDTAPAHHSPFFKIEPEPAVQSGVEGMVIAAMALFAEGAD